MKKVLVITYYWPPSGGAGVQRWLKFVKYFRDYGWEPVVYTPENPEAPVIDYSLEKDVPENLKVIRHPIWEPYAAYKSFIGQKKEERINAGFLSESKKPKRTQNFSVWIRGNLFIPDARKYWIRPSIKFLKKFLEENPVDAMVTTGPPHSMHMIGLGLKKALGIPWLADFRDPWTNIDFYDQLKLTSWADRKHRRMERKVLANADQVVVISPGMADDFRGIFERDYQVITNGFDPDDFNKVSKLKKPGKFRLTHIGTLVKTRNPVQLWQGLKEIISENKQFAEAIEICLIGKVDYSVQQSIHDHQIDAYIEKIDYVEHSELPEYQQKAAVLLLLINDSPNAKMILTGKLFEYIGSGRPILCVGPEDGDAAKIIKKYDLGKVCVYHEKDKLKQSLLEFYDQYLKDKVTTRESDISKFSRQELTNHMTVLLNQMIISAKS